ncbi:MAG: hypothetical protein PF569_01455 [Candidatus Woesearchaeota archaeon]|jgi:hypothetical protein|nr:hypothetical protein [Candidatus Woesearchaeota archaeon]
MCIKERQEKGAVIISNLMTAYTPKGEPLEFSLKESPSKLVGSVGSNTRGEEFKVLGNINKKDKSGKYRNFLVEFLDKTLIVVRGKAIESGEFRNPNAPRVCGIGFLGQGIHNSVLNNKMSKEYQTWNSMLHRCYSEVYQEGKSTYKGCSVDKRWHNFQNFCEDIQYLQGYKEWKETSIPNAWALDKDIKIDGNKIYSSGTCMFVTIKENVQKATLGKEINLSGNTFLMTNLETGEEKEFFNIKKFARDNNLQQACISRCIRGEQHTHAGLTFRLLEDE